MGSYLYNLTAGFDDCSPDIDPALFPTVRIPPPPPPPLDIRNGETLGFNRAHDTALPEMKGCSFSKSEALVGARTEGFLGPSGSTERSSNVENLRFNEDL